MCSSEAMGLDLAFLGGLGMSKSRLFRIAVACVISQYLSTLHYTYSLIQVLPVSCDEQAAGSDGGIGRADAAVMSCTICSVLFCFFDRLCRPGRNT